MAARTQESTRHPSIDATGCSTSNRAGCVGLLDAATLCAISTVSPRTTAHINIAYFACDHEFDIFWLSDPAAKHSRNIRARPNTAIAHLRLPVGFRNSRTGRGWLAWSGLVS
jgi:hypothetical protein